MEPSYRFSVKYGGREGAVQVYPSGSLQFVTTSGSAPGSCFGPMPTSWEGEDVIGAKVLEHGSSATVHVYHCPDHQKGEHIVRPVKQAGPFTVVDVQSAKQFAQEVNPEAGKGKAVQIWEQAQHLLEAAGVKCESVVTTHAGHAIQEIASLDLELHACIIGVGGDGLVHEILQGLRRHLLMPKSFATPICHLPAGSGNGLSATFGLWTPETAVHALVKGSVKSIDAASVFLASESVPRLSILSVQYGLLADLDLGTEHLRRLLGGERFTYGAVREIVKWRKHKANIAFFQEPASEAITSEKDVKNLVCPRLEALGGQQSFDDVSGWPEGWTVQKRDSIRFLNLAGPGWAALDAHLNPWADTSDGLWEFAWDKCQGRFQMLKMILETQAGNHDKSPLFDMERVSAFVIEPVDTTTYLTVDGEKVELEKLSMEVHRKLVKFVCA